MPIRELKNKLSEYLRLVKSGEQVLVSERGVVVAEIRQPGPGRRWEGKYPGLASIEAKGAACIGAPNDPVLYPALRPVLRSTTSAELLEAERGERR